MARHFATFIAGVLLCLCAVAHAAAAELHGMVTFGGLPVPGAMVTVKQNAKAFSTITDQGGLYHFKNLANGQWAIEITMQCFRTIDAQVMVGVNATAGKWELTLLPMDQDQLLASTKIVQSPILAPPKLSISVGNVAQEMPKPPAEASQESADGLLVQGSENNAATSRYSTSPAFGNTRPGGRALYTGGLEALCRRSSRFPTIT